MSDAVTLSKDEYDLLKQKADLFDHFVETEELSTKELARIQQALKGPFLTESEFIKNHPELR
jgi:hypothetical protein